MEHFIYSTKMRGCALQYAGAHMYNLQQATHLRVLVHKLYLWNSCKAID